MQFNATPSLRSSRDLALKHSHHGAPTRDFANRQRDESLGFPTPIVTELSLQSHFSLLPIELQMVRVPVHISPEFYMSVAKMAYSTVL